MKEAGQLLVKHEAELNYEKIVELKKARKEKDLQQRYGQKIRHEDNAQNKARYPATQDACRWAGTVIKEGNQAFGQEQ